MGDSISDVVNSCELVKYKPLIMLHGGSAPGFGWQNIKQHSTTSCELPGSKHIPPETKTQFSNQFTVSVRVVQLLDCIVDSGFSHPALRVIENTTQSSGITLPIVAKGARVMLVNGISEGDFKTTDDGKKLLG